METISAVAFIASLVAINGFKAVGFADEAVELALLSLAKKRVVARGAGAGDYLSLRALLAG